MSLANQQHVLGIIGGSGVYDIDGLVNKRWQKVDSPFGEPSDEFLMGELAGQEMVFLPRHGRGHRVPPSEINFRANIDARIESRGFIIGAALAFQLGVGLVPVRKKGKLPAKTVGHDYELEYGSDRIEIHVDAISPGDRILLVDDLIATGGTAEAAVKLIEEMSGEIVECCFVIDLPDLGGRKRLENYGQKVFTLCEFGGD